jgi:pimeloyl-ACP methyl ester carboxylesterase
MRTLILVSAAFLLLPAAHAATETGTLNGAQFRIDIPDRWNGTLVMYCHGYNPKPVTFEADKPLPEPLAVFPASGAALAQSGYSAGGWAVEQAMVDIQSLKRYFVSKYGRPKHTFITGHSMGGFLTMMLAEKFPTSYDAAMPLCGPLDSTVSFIGQDAFGSLVIFNYLYPGVLPEPGRFPADFEMSKELGNKVQSALDANPETAKLFLAYTRAHSTKDLAGSLVLIAYVVKELEIRAGGNPFDNRAVIYDWPGDQNALNDGVKRYAASPAAALYLKTWYTPTGRIAHPMLAIHTTYDPIVPTRVPAAYAALTEEAGTDHLFVQQYVHHDGHCTMTPEEISAGFRELRAWTEHGVKPSDGALPR